MARHLVAATLLLPLLAVAAPAAEVPAGTASSSCTAGSACEGSEDASLLQVGPKRHVLDSKESASAARSLVADVWLTSVDSKGQAIGTLVRGSPVPFHNPGARAAASASTAAARGAAAAPEPEARLQALPEEKPPTMDCKSFDGAANRACVIVPPSMDESLLETEVDAHHRTWSDINGGVDQACRGDDPDDNSESYYKVVKAHTQGKCKKACEKEACCTGIEYRESEGRCELWTKEIKASKTVEGGFVCSRLTPMAVCTTTTTTTTMDNYWVEINGGSSQACRGDNVTDTDDSYFTLTTHHSLSDCRTACQQAACCTGIEYQDSTGRCELWTKKIQATTGVGGYRCEQLQPMSTCAVWDGITRVTVEASKEKQTMRGFGAAMTQSSAYVLKKLKQKDSGLYDTVMDRLFGTGSHAAGISMVRFPIGSCDFAMTERTYADVNQMSGCHLKICDSSCSIPGACGSDDCSTCNWCQACCCKAADYQLDTFALDPETETIVEILQDAKQKNSGLVIMGSPWTPPAWLKKWGLLAGQHNDNTLLGGDAPVQTYAKYFLKIKTTFSEKGVPIEYLTLQNEPLFAPTYPGMYLSSWDYGRLAKAVKEKVGDSPRILAYDHNWDHPEYALQAMQQAGEGVFFGTAFHCYNGSMSKAHSYIQTKQPEDLDIMMSECTGSFSGSRCDINKGMDGFGWNHEWDMDHLFLNNVLHGGSASMKWVMVLDEHCGPYLPNMHFHWGRPLVSIPSWASKIGDVKFNQDFWTVAHMARFVRPGAKLVELDVTSGGSASRIGAFKDESAGTMTLIAMNNDHKEKLELEVTYKGHVLAYPVPAWGSAVLRWPS